VRCALLRLKVRIPLAKWTGLQVTPASSTHLQPFATPESLSGKYGHFGRIPPIGGGHVDNLPLYIRGGLYGQPINISYTEEVAGSSPVPPITVSMIMLIRAAWKPKQPFF